MKGKGLLAILSGPDKRSDEDTEAEPDKTDSVEHRAAGDLMAALKDDDTSGFLDAFKRLSRACQESYGEDDEEMG
jgi:hypothetical protein